MSENTEKVRTGDCRMCGTCCRDMGLHKNGKKIGRESIEEIMKENPHLRYFCTHDGWDRWYCTAQGPDNLCTIHENRPAMCRLYPFKGKDLRGDFCGYRFISPLEAVTALFGYLNGH